MQLSVEQAARILEVADKDEIRELLYTYCMGVDRLDKSLVRSVFHEDARLDYGLFQGTPAEFADFSLDFLKGMGGTSHNITNNVIKVDGDTANSVSYCIAMHGGIDSIGSQTDYTIYARYIDRCERREGVWKIAHREVAYDWNEMPASTVKWGKQLSPQRGRRDTTDPSYRVLPKSS